MAQDEVHVATFDDLDARTAYRLWQLREAVFVVEQECPYAELDGRDLEEATRHLWIADGGVPVGYLRLLDDGDAARIGRVLVATSHRGRGLAELLMRRALTIVGARACRLDAQSYLSGWYVGFGFEPCGPEFLEDGIPHVPMRRAVAAPDGNRV
jgi:ElaA protein